MPKKVSGLANSGEAGGLIFMTTLVETGPFVRVAVTVEVKVPADCGRPVISPLVPGATTPGGKPLAP